MNMPFDLQAARTRCEMATPGPWGWEAVDDSLLNLQTKGTMEWILAVTRCESCQKEPQKRCYWPEHTDGTFIAHARTDLPAALDVIEAMAEALTRSDSMLSLLRHRAANSFAWGEVGMPDLTHVDEIIGQSRTVLALVK